MALINPYTPGAGTRPDVLAGRETQLSLIDERADRVEAGREASPLILTGLRGLGKTSLLQEARDRFRERGWLAGYYEVRRNVPPGDAVRGIIEDHDQLESPRLLKALRDLKTTIGNVRVGVGPAGFTFETTATQGAEADPYADLVRFFRDVGRRVAGSGAGVALLIDELQVFRKRDSAVLIQALGAVRELPVALVGAGLPYLASELSKANTYAERFRYEQIDFLSTQEIVDAVRGPALAQGVVWADDAVDAVVRLSMGYPYFVQLYASEGWNTAHARWTSDEAMVHLMDVDEAAPLVSRQLDVGLYSARYDRLSEGEREYVDAMVELLDEADPHLAVEGVRLARADGRVRSGDVAERLRKSSTQLGPVRERIIRKGIIHSPRHNQLDFSVPGFDDYVRRRREPL